MRNKQPLIGIVVIVVIVLLVGVFRVIPLPVMAHDMDMEREDFISQKSNIITSLLSQGKYKCCLEKPCTYCIEKSPGHGEGATCNCLEDVVTGVHPCGECIGEILEGHGNKYLARYFARAIAEKTGHEDAIKQIISEKYDLPVEDQI